MIGRQIAIGFGIAILIPLLIYYGVRTFSPAPEYQNYITNIPFNPTATPEERQANAEKQKVEQKAFRDAQSQFSRHLFYVSAPLGYAAILTGGLMAVSAVGTGLIFGGIFSVINGYFNYINGYFNYWTYIPDWERFVSLIIAAAVLLFVAYQKVSKPDKSPL